MFEVRETMSSQQPDLFSRIFSSCLESLGFIKSQAAPPDEAASSKNNSHSPVITGKIYDWARSENIQLHAIHDFTSWGRNDIHLFYVTTQDFERYSKDGTSERLKQQFIKVAKDVGVSEQVIEQWEFNFGSCEEIDRNYGGYQRYFN